MKKTRFDGNIYNREFWILIGLVITFVIALFYDKIKTVTSGKVAKQTLVDFYKVDKKTFNKWVKYFCPSIFPDMSTYNRKRKLTFSEAFQIVSHLGFPHDFPVMTKKQIIEKSEGSYQSLRESVKAYPDLFGIIPGVFVKLNKFPPNISRMILEQYN